MAAKKKPTSRVPATRGFAIVLEDMRSQFKVFGEALQGLSERVDVNFKVFGLALGGLSDKVDGLTHRVDGLTHRVDGLTNRVDVLTNSVDVLTNRVDVGFKKVDDRLEALERDVGLVKVAVLDLRRELSTKVSRDEVEGLLTRTSPS
jgi:uncharacterized protein YoxC